MKYGLALVTLLASTAFGATRAISQSELKEKWPLTVSDGQIECRTGQVLLFRHKTLAYTLNGTARMKLPRVPPIDAIWKPDPKKFRAQK
jgi:hypothetical protein